MVKLAIVLPCYNEEKVLPLTFEAISCLLNSLIDKRKIASDSYALFVDDGSKDKTWEIIENKSCENRLVKGLKLSANVGHQNALVAGLMVANDDSDVTVSIDADLQDDETVIEKMIDKFNDGCDIVYGVRNSRKTDSVFKRTSAQGFYKFMNLMGAKTVYNHADFRLMSHRAIEQLSEYGERNLYLRGIVPLIGYKTDCVYYDRKERAAGESKYPLKKMLSFAFDGITSFSTKPLKLITFMGFVIVLCSFCAFVYALVSYFMHNVQPGWASLIISIWFIGGVQLICIGIVGQYIGKIYTEVKKRPRYNIEKKTEK